jgi:(5-formylfuran-3-yl)methyl phosphate synthase
MNPLRLLVSVRDDIEARAAVDGGADIIDAKDPTQGALGPVKADTLAAILAAIVPVRPVSAALGDIGAFATAEAAEACGRAMAQLGLAFIKVGLAGTPDTATASALLAALRRGLAVAEDEGPALVLTAYADTLAPGAAALAEVLDVAHRAGCGGVMLDTARKAPGATLFDHVAAEATGAWINSAHGAGMFVALAGTLGADDIPRVRALGADIVGVRGAACDGGRAGTVTAERVRVLAALVAQPTPAAKR